MRARPGWIEIPACLLSTFFGSLLPFSLAPFGWWPLGIISIAGLANLLCSQQTTRTRFVRVLCFGLGVYGIGVSWIYVAIHDHGGAGIALSVLMVTLFVGFLALLLSLPFLLLGKVLNSSNANTYLLVFPSLWVVGEWFRGWAFTGFPWLYLGYGHTETWLLGWAPVVGALGVSWITAFCGALLALIFKITCNFKAGNRHIKQLLSPLFGVSLVAFFWFGGYFLKGVHWTQPSGKLLSIGLVQPAVPLEIKWDPYKLPQIFEQLRADTELLFNNDLVVWPESAIPRLKNEVADYLSAISVEAKETNTALITGIPTAETGGNSPTRPGSFYSKYYNSVIGLGVASGVYHKQHLVPFGEYVPFENWLRGTIAFFDLPMSAFSSGPLGQTPIKAKGTNIATAVCYEVAYAELVRRSATEANLLLTLSNDTWFGKSIGPKQHFQIARMRAVENEKPLIRATNDGISALITADGRVSAIAPSYKRHLLEGALEPRTGLTPFGRYGSFPILLTSLLCVLLPLLGKSVLWVVQKMRNTQAACSTHHKNI